MILENEILKVELDDGFPNVERALHKPTGTWIDGTRWDRMPAIVVNGRAHSVAHAETTPIAPGSYWVHLRHIGATMTLSYTLEGCELALRVSDIQESPKRKQAISTIYLDGLTPVRVGPEWRYRRERFHQRPWDEECGRGIWDPRTETGLVGAAIPDCRPPAITFGCLWKDGLCITAGSSSLVKPIELTMHEGPPNRTGSASLQAGVYHYRAGEKVLDPFEFRIAFLEDMNGDGTVDYMDAFTWYRRRLPEPDQMYRESVLHKIFCATPERIFTTFDQCLEIVKMVHLISDGAPQIVYLVGWQYDGHDTGYPALDRVNERLGGREALLRQVEEAHKYNATISYHINLDDAYTDSPAWDPEIICRNTDGPLMEYEVFGGRLAYHISHTKDVESGKVFRRLEAMLDTVPVEKTIHIDAFRISNESWEPDRYIGMVEELELGVKPILEWLRERGIDPTCESIDRFPADLTGLVSCVWHVQDPGPQFGKLLGGGKGEDLMAWAKGNSIDTDLTPEVGFDRVADMICLGTRLYQLYLTRELMDFRWTGHNRFEMRLGDDGFVEADGAKQAMRVRWGDIDVARDFDRFIPAGPNTIYAYSSHGGRQQWTLPAHWEGARIESSKITPEGVTAGPELSITGRIVRFDADPHRPVILRLIEH